MSFTLVVDDFGVNYIGRDNFQHLCDALCDLYEVTVGELGSKYLGMTLDWNYDNKTVDILMPGYIEKALHRFQHVPTKVQKSSHIAARINYGQKEQMVTVNERK